MKQIAMFQFCYQQQYQQIIVHSIIQWKFPNKSPTFPWSPFHDFGRRKEKQCLFLFEGEWLKHFDHTILNESILMNPNAPREMFEYKRGHVEIGPSGQKLLYCPYEGCDKVLTSSPGLRYHMRTHSANDRPFHCNRCKKTFKRQVLVGLLLSVYFWLEGCIQGVCSYLYVDYKELVHRKGNFSVIQSYCCDITRPHAFTFICFAYWLLLWG